MVANKWEGAFPWVEITAPSPPAPDRPGLHSVSVEYTGLIGRRETFRTLTQDPRRDNDGGVEALANLRGQSDLFGRLLEVSEHAVADSIAGAAELLLGEADEAIPVVILRGLNEGHSEQDARTLLRPEQEDMFR